MTADYGSSVQTIVDEFAVGVITGETDPNAQWDAYLTNLNGAGYDKIRAKLDKVPLHTEVIAGN